MAITDTKFVFRKHTTIGAASAENDQEFLSQCFVDIGDLDVLRDCSNPRCIVLGRTGTGKTALLSRLQETEEHVINISPETLSLTYISNSTILKFLQELGVRLDLFYKLLWRHVFAVELIRARYKLHSAGAKTWLQHMRDRFAGTNKAKKEALDYVVSWGEHFWEETEYRIKEITNKFETQLTDELKGVLGGSTTSSLSLTSGQVDKLSEETKSEIVKRAQQVVNRVQVKELNHVLDMLSEDVLDNPQQRFYVIVDRLDENWADDEIRFRLIRALIETVRDFYSVKNAKVIIAIRSDLLERVIRFTRDTGFQEEKYESLYLRLKWSKEQLTELLDARIDALVRRQYTKQTVTHVELLPRHLNRADPIEYMLDRTLYRPRDIILFFNLCIDRCVGLPKISAANIQETEGEYSRKMLRSLADEWSADIPNLLDFAGILRAMPDHFRIDALHDDDVQMFCLELVVDSLRLLPHDPLVITATQVANGQLEPWKFRNDLIYRFYRVGLLGLKLESYSPVSWALEQRRSVSTAELRNTAVAHIHPAYWRTLGISPPGKASRGRD